MSQQRLVNIDLRWMDTVLVSLLAIVYISDDLELGSFTEQCRRHCTVLQNVSHRVPYLFLFLYNQITVPRLLIGCSYIPATIVEVTLALSIHTDATYIPHHLMHFTYVCTYIRNIYGMYIGYLFVIHTYICI